MIEQSIISLILDGAGVKILHTYGLSLDMFLTCKDEIKFILSHFSQYKQVPDKKTFLAQFKEFQMLDVSESVDYLAYKLREAYIYTKMAGIIQTTADMVRDDSIKALDYLKGSIKALEDDTPTTTAATGYDIISQSKDRLQAYKERCEKKGLIGIPTGVPQLDDITNGWLWGEDLIIVTGRTNVGKSWIGEYFGVKAWQLSYKVLMYSGEMSHEIVGFRFDTLNEHYSNMGLLNGSTSLSSNKSYDDYIDELSKKSNGFVVVTPEDFGGRKPTVDDLKMLAKKVDADLIIVDQISLMTDQRKAEQTRIMYNNISEDLFLMSKELKKPVIAMAQSNREAVKNKKKGQSPELHELSESDGIAQNATRVISITVIDGTLKLSLKKNRYGINNKDVMMIWDVNLGILKPLLKSPEKDGKSKDEKEYGF